MKKLLFLLLASLYPSQVLISNANETNPEPHPSAMLEARSNDKGVSVPQVSLKSSTDKTTILNPTEGTVALNMSVYNATTHPDIPSTKPTIVTWNGTNWLFGFKEDDTTISLDFIRNYSADNGSTVVKFDSKTNSNVFPGNNADPVAILNEPLAAPWVVLIDTLNKTQPSYRLHNSQANQRMVIDAEGIAAINNVSAPNSGFNYAYEVGIFVNDKLVGAQKFMETNLGGSCHYSKYNIVVIIDSPILPTPVEKNTPYNVKLAVRPLSRGTTVYFDRMVFGDDVGYGYNTTDTCNNLNTDTARSYMNILTIEKKK